MEIFYNRLTSRYIFYSLIIFSLVTLHYVTAYSQCSTPSVTSASGCPGTYTLTVTSINSSVTSHKWYTTSNGSGTITPTSNQSIGTGTWQSTYQTNFTSSITYYVAAVCGSTESARVPVSFTSTGSTISISSSSDPMSVSAGSSVTLTASSSGGTYQWRYGNTSSGIIGTGSVSVAKGGTYFASGSNNCGMAQSGSIQVNFLPIADAGPDKTIVTPTTNVTLYGSGSDPDGGAISFSWSKVSPVTAVTMTGTTTSVLNVSGLPTSPETFVFQLQVTDSNGKIHSDLVNVIIATSSNNNNYVMVEDVKIPGQTSNSQVSGLTVASKSTTYKYTDGLGKAIQTVQWQASPTGTDLIAAYEYDELQRQKRTYLPVQQSQTSGFLISNLLGNGNYVGSPHYNFYNNGVPGVQSDAKAYAESDFELSPIGRVVKQGTVGSGFQPGENDIDVAYTANTANDIRVWSISADLPVSSGTWEANLLSVVSSIDAQGVESQVITNRQGLKLLSRTMWDAMNWAETYYVYDDRNNLRFILPPELIRIIKTSGFRNPTQTEIDTWASQYIYDVEGRVVETKGPGKATSDWSYSIYDKRDRLVLSQDPKQRLNAEWSYTKYDDLNREVISGIYRPGTAISRSSMQSTVDGLSGAVGYQNISPQTNNGVKAGLDLVIDTYNSINEYKAINSIVIKPGFTFTAGVTASSFQARIDDGSGGTTADVFPTTNDEPLVINIFDDYKDCVVCQENTYQFISESWASTSNEPYQKVNSVRGMLVASSVKVLGANQRLQTVTYYDRNYAPIQSTSSTHLGGTVRNSILRDFSGKTIETVDVYAGFNMSVNSIRNRYVYDNSGRLSKTYHQINNQSEIVLNAFEYNSVGQLIDKKIHSSDNGFSYLQSIDYKYSIRGEPLAMNSTFGTDSGDPTDYFGIEFSSNNSFGALNSARYDGMISGLKWRTDLPDNSLKVKEKGYSYSYNNLGWLTGSSYKENIYNDPSSNWNQVQNTFFNEDGISYDYNGNIKGLSRKTQISPLTSSTIDQLTYDYGGSSGGNKLLFVSDGAPASDKDKGFNDGNSVGNDYSYDVNGNVILDKNKGIASTTYNFQNLPDRVTFNDNSYIQYLYDASGVKLRQTFYNSSNQPVIKNDYIDGIIFSNDQFQLINHAEGRIISPDYQNLVPNPTREANGSEGFTANGNVTISTQFANGQNYVKVLSNQSAGTAGVWPIGNSTYTVKPGENYSFKVLGYQETGTSAKLYVSNPSGALIWSSSVLPQGVSNENWVTVSFSVPQGVTQIKLGVLWDVPETNNIFYINRVALYKTDFEYQYFLKDHLGSPRVVLGTIPSVLTFTATMETENFANESANFLNLNSGFFEVNPVANATPGGNEVIRMNNAYRVGPSRSFKVFPGDAVDASVKAYYASASGLTQATYTTMAAALSTIMSGGSQAIVDGIGSAYGNSSSSQPGFALSPSQGTTKPSAFINYILFDENYKPLEAKSQPLGSAGSLHTISLPSISVKQAGYIFIYLSYDNENTDPVYFDDLKIVYTESPVIQINNYYAFGLTSIEWVREGETDNNFLFQGKELNDQTGLHDFHARQYDAKLGRWFVMDPERQFASPYNGMGNSPVMGTDPDGKFWHIVIGAAIGGVVNLGVKAYQGKIHSWGDGFSAFGIGALAGGVGAATGGAAFVAAGGAAAGAGGFVAGFGSGAVGAMFASPIQSIGNTLAFGDAPMTMGEYALSIALGGITGGVTNGVLARVYGKSFWNGSTRLGTGLNPIPDLPKIEMNYKKPTLDWEPKIERTPTERLATRLGDGLDDLPPTRPNPTRISLEDGGSNIALGVREHLDDFAKNVNGSTWKSWGAADFESGFMNTINNSANKIHFNLTGIDNPWSAISQGAKGFQIGGYTNWELFQLYSSPGALQRTTFYLNGKVVPNPF